MTGFLGDLPEIKLDAQNAKRKTRKRAKIRPKMSTTAVIYHVTKCPECGSDRTYVYDSHQKPIRYHKCRACKVTFQSYEPA